MRVVPVWILSLALGFTLATGAGCSDDTTPGTTDGGSSKRDVSTTDSATSDSAVTPDNTVMSDATVDTSSGVDTSTGSDSGADVGAEDAGTTADTGTADTGTADTGTADTGTADTGTADTGTAADTLSPDSAAPVVNSNAYDVEVQWGGSSAAWNVDGLWIIGGRPTQSVTNVDIQSADSGSTFTGTIQYAGEGSISFKATKLCGNTYKTEVQWGGSSQPWHANGTWMIGGRTSKRAVEVKVSSNDGGVTFTGTMKYAGEGSISFKAQQNAAAFFNSYAAEAQWGGASAPWNGNGVWLIGGRASQHAVALDISSSDSGVNFTGTMKYAGEGPIAFKAVQKSGNVYAAEVQWGGSSAPWHANGTWIIGCRDTQRAVKVNISSSDGGETFSGTMNYAGEGAISFRSTNID
jgi:hypothetical protein